jgi:hypothetical protein
MVGNVIQGSFLSGQPKLPSQPRIPPPPPIQAKTAVRPPVLPIPASNGRTQPVALPIQPRSLTRRPGPPAPTTAWRPAAVQRHGDAFAIEGRQLGLVSSGGRMLPDAVRTKMETALGADFSNVRVHVGPHAERIGAIAFTVGSDIYFAPGRYQPDTLQGQQLLGHELTHVVQQRAGKVRNPLGSGLAVVQDRALEAEADRLGQRAAAFRVADQWRRAFSIAQPSAPVRISPPINFRARPVESIRPHAGRATAIQAQLTFASRENAHWMTDKTICSLCGTAMRRGHRHHCRVCGKSVCDDCGKGRFSVQEPLISGGGKARGSSVERVCVDCILTKKIEIAHQGSAKFRELRNAARNPAVIWGRVHPNYQRGRIYLSPSSRRVDPFADYVFELTNAAAEEDHARYMETATSREEYGLFIETQEYIGLIRREEVVREILAQQRYFNITLPTRKELPEHLEDMIRGGHTEQYYRQWDEA